MDLAPLAAQYFDANFRLTLALSLLVSAAAFIVMRLYTRAIMRESQRTTAPVQAAATAERSARSDSEHVPHLDMRIETLERDPDTAPRSATFRHAERAFTRAAWCYVVAGVVHAAVSTALLFNFDFYARPTTSSALTVFACYAAIFWAWFFTTFFGLALFYGPDRRRRTMLVVGYIAVLPLAGIALWLAGAPRIPLSDVTMVGADLRELMLSFARAVTGEAATADTATFGPLTQPTFFYTLSAVPFVIPVLAFNRFIRGTVGPVFITFALLVTLGPLLVMDILIVTIRRFDLEAIFGASPSRILWPVSFAGAVLIAALVLLWTVRLYRRRHLSDQAFLFDALWLSVSICVTVYLLGNKPRFVYLLGLLPFALYKLVTSLGFRCFVAGDTPLSNARLLFLRVFGSARRSEKLFDLLAARWRYAGTVQLISGTDMARSRFEPDEFLDFIAGRFASRYITSVADIERRLAEVETRPDLDGRYRVHEFFCRADMWQPTVVRLMALSELVAMDLRGFTADRHGCAFELAALIDNVPMDRVVLLIDRTTDVQLLRDMIQRLWNSMVAESPNAGTAGAALKMIDLERSSYPRAVRRLMQIGDGIE